VFFKRDSILFDLEEKSQFGLIAAVTRTSSDAEMEYEKNFKKIANDYLEGILNEQEKDDAAVQVQNKYNNTIRDAKMISAIVYRKIFQIHRLKQVLYWVDIIFPIAVVVALFCSIVYKEAAILRFANSSQIHESRP
jgi:hypothetical protein